MRILPDEMPGFCPGVLDGEGKPERGLTGVTGHLGAAVGLQSRAHGLWL